MELSIVIHLSLAIQNLVHSHFLDFALLRFIHNIFWVGGGFRLSQIIGAVKLLVDFGNEMLRRCDKIHRTLKTVLSLSKRTVSSALQVLPNYNFPNYRCYAVGIFKPIFSKISHLGLIYVMLFGVGSYGTQIMSPYG